MKHKWITDPNPIDPKGTYPKLVEQKVCSVCGCSRWKSVAKDYVNYMYSRSTQVFNRIPDCIDWEVENNKTID